MPKSNRAWEYCVPALSARSELAIGRLSATEGLGFCCACRLLSGIRCASPQAQTLTQALAEAYNTNPQLLAQRALLRATDEQVPQALANWRPTVNFTGQVGGNAKRFYSTEHRDSHRQRAGRLFDLPSKQPQSPGNPAGLPRRSDRGADEPGDQQRTSDPGADPGGRDDGIPGCRPSLSRCRARPGACSGQSQQRGGPAQAARSDPGSISGRRSDPHRCRPGRILAGAGHWPASHRRKAT